MAPKIDFRWSYIYQENVHLSKDIKYNREKFSKEVKDFIINIKKEWNPVYEDILNYMAELTGSKWKKSEIICYVVHTSEKYPVSDPLTIPINLKTSDKIYTLNKEKFIDMLIHELIHNLFIQNETKMNRYFSKLYSSKYKDKSWNTLAHVPVHAIHKKIFLKFFNEDRLKKEIELCKYYPDYKESWEIVTKEGCDLIIKNIKSS